MRAAVYLKHGKPEDVLQAVEVDDPNRPGRGEVLIRVLLRPVHHGDLFGVAGRYQPGSVVPKEGVRVGFEGYGIVEEAGDAPAPGIPDQEHGRSSKAKAFMDLYQAAHVKLAGEEQFECISILGECAISLPRAPAIGLNRILGLGTLEDLDEAYDWMSQKTGKRFSQANFDAASDEPRYWIQSKARAAYGPGRAKLRRDASAGSLPTLGDSSAATRMARCVAGYALLFFAGLAAAQFAYQTGSGLIGAGLDGLLSAGAAFGILAGLFERIRSPVIRLIVALIFAAPAAVAGYALVYGITKEAVPSDIRRQVFCIAGSGFIGLLALARLMNGVGQAAK